jgi:hypothetical protein
MDNIDIEDFLGIQMESQERKIDTSDEFPEGTKVKITNTNDQHLMCYVHQLGIVQSTVRYEKGVKKSKVRFDNGVTAYFKNEFLEKVDNH